MYITTYKLFSLYINVHQSKKLKLAFLYDKKVTPPTSIRLQSIYIFLITPNKILNLPRQSKVRKMKIK